MSQIGHSQTARTMGAVVRIAGPPIGLYLVVGHGTGAGLEALVTRAGGRIAVRLKPTALLAVLPFEGYLVLKADARLASIGPVSIDPARARNLAEILAGTPASGTDTARKKKQNGTINP